MSFDASSEVFGGEDFALDTCGLSLIVQVYVIAHRLELLFLAYSNPCCLHGLCKHVTIQSRRLFRTQIYPRMDPHLRVEAFGRCENDSRKKWPTKIFREVFGNDIFDGLGRDGNAT